MHRSGNAAFRWPLRLPKLSRRRLGHLTVILLLILGAFLAGFDLALVAVLHDWLPPDAKTFAEHNHAGLTAWVGFLGSLAAILDHRKPPEEAP